MGVIEQPVLRHHPAGSGKAANRAVGGRAVGGDEQRGVAQASRTGSGLRRSRQTLPGSCHSWRSPSQAGGRSVSGDTKNFAPALEQCFRQQEPLLKKATPCSRGKARPAAQRLLPATVAQERRARQRQRVSLHQGICKLYREGYPKEQMAQLLGVSSGSVYRARQQEAPAPAPRRSRSSSIVDPYLS